MTEKTKRRLILFGVSIALMLLSYAASQYSYIAGWAPGTGPAGPIGPIAHPHLKAISSVAAGVAITSFWAAVGLWVIPSLFQRRVIRAGCLLLVGAGLYFNPPVMLLRTMFSQLKAGRIYMDTMTEGDIRTWIARVDKLLDEHKASSDLVRLGSQDIPAELRQLGIRRVDVQEPNYVGFMWLGSALEHTGLMFHKGSNSNYTVVAHYSDNRERQSLLSG